MGWFRTFLLGVALVVAAAALSVTFPEMEWNRGAPHFGTPDEAAFMAWLAALVVGLPLIGVGALGCAVRWVLELRRRTSSAAASS